MGVRYYCALEHFRGISQIINHTWARTPFPTDGNCWWMLLHKVMIKIFEKLLSHPLNCCPIHSWELKSSVEFQKLKSSVEFQNDGVRWLYFSKNSLSHILSSLKSIFSQQSNISYLDAFSLPISCKFHSTELNDDGFQVRDKMKRYVEFVKKKN